MTNSTTSKAIADKIAEDVDEFERMLIICMSWNEEVFREIRNYIPQDVETADALFRNPLNLALFRAIEKYNGAIIDVGGAIRPTAIPISYISQNLYGFMGQAKYVSEQEIQQVLHMYMKAWQDHGNAHAIDIVKSGWRIWMHTRQRLRVLQLGCQNPEFDVAQELSQVQRTLSTAGETQTFYSIDQAAMITEKPVLRMPTGLPALDRALGGGFAQGEGNLIIGASGAGKSVVSSQFGFDMSEQGPGYKGLHIITEMTVRDIALRVISNKCKIPFSLIKDGMNLSTITTNPKQQEAYDKLMASMTKNWRVMRWKDDDNRAGIFTKLDDLLKRAADEMGGLHYAHLDWLGGGLSKHLLNDPSMIRHTWQTGADSCAELAERHKISFTVYAQGHPKDSINKRKVGPEMTSECKSLHRMMTTAIGISAIRKNAENEEEEEASSYEEIQWLFLGKSRKSEGGCVPFRRRFDQMRLEPVNT